MGSRIVLIEPAWGFVGTPAVPSFRDGFDSVVDVETPTISLEDGTDGTRGPYMPSTILQLPCILLLLRVKTILDQGICTRNSILMLIGPGARCSLSQKKRHVSLLFCFHLHFSFTSRQVSGTFRNYSSLIYVGFSIF